MSDLREALIAAITQVSAGDCSPETINEIADACIAVVTAWTVELPND